MTYVKLWADADPCHSKVESAKYDKWEFNGSGAAAVWKGRLVSSTSSTGLCFAHLQLVNSLSSVIWIPKAPLSPITSAPDVQTDCIAHSELTKPPRCVTMGGGGVGDVASLVHVTSRDLFKFWICADNNTPAHLEHVFPGACVTDKLPVLHLCQLPLLY